MGRLHGDSILWVNLRQQRLLEHGRVGFEVGDRPSDSVPTRVCGSDGWAAVNLLAWAWSLIRSPALTRGKTLPKTGEVFAPRKAQALTLAPNQLYYSIEAAREGLEHIEASPCRPPVCGRRVDAIGMGWNICPHGFARTPPSPAQGCPSSRTQLPDHPDPAAAAARWFQLRCRADRGASRGGSGLHPRGSISPRPRLSCLSQPRSTSPSLSRNGCRLAPE